MQDIRSRAENRALCGEFAGSALACSVTPIATAQTESRARLTSVDALRGLAAILMVQQHLGIWMVNSHAYSPVLRAIFVAINMTGGAAAPLFITLSGVSSALGERTATNGNTAADGLRRGAILLLFGVVLNLLVPSWFSLWSFYVLHLLGVWLIAAPWALRLPNVGLLLLAGLILVGAVLGQSVWETPLSLNNELMRSTERAGGALRLALLESQFPVFPWLALAVGGAWAGRILSKGEYAKLFSAAVVCGGLAGFLRGLVLVIPSAANELPWRAVCRTGRTFFPMSTVYALSLFALCLLLLATFSWLEAQKKLSPNSWFVPLGRSSLSLLVFHIVFFREGLIAAGLRRELSPGIAVLVIVGFLAAWTFAARRWSQSGYKYGLEWLLRRG